MLCFHVGFIVFSCVLYVYMCVVCFFMCVVYVFTCVVCVFMCVVSDVCFHVHGSRHMYHSDRRCLPFYLETGSLVYPLIVSLNGP